MAEGMTVNSSMLALFSLVLGGLVTYLVGVFSAKTATDLSLLNDQIRQFDRIQAAAISYWHHDPKTAPELERQLENTLQGEVAASSYFATDAERIMRSGYFEYMKLDGELYDLVTGGAFQTASKAPDFERVIKIMVKCHEIRAFLRSSRRSIFGPR